MSPRNDQQHLIDGKGDGMSRDELERRTLGRRDLLKLAGGSTVLAVGLGMSKSILRPFSAQPAGAANDYLAQIRDDKYMFLGGTDGWIWLPPTPAIGFFHPDAYGVGKGPGGSDMTDYVFGFRNLTELDATQRSAQKEHAQHSAPLFWVEQFDPSTAETAATNEFVVDITNLGLAMRPDLFDAHTLHWHGFRNVIPFFDGEPTGSVSVPAGTVFRYVYRPRDPGTYMYHCHVEDVEHVHMGMNGMVFVRPLQNRLGGGSVGPGQYLYNDGDGSTAYDREYSLHLSEVWAEAHWADAHIQLPEWSDYHPDFSMINGRVYPDTTLPNAPYPTGLDAWVPGDPWSKPYMPVAHNADGTMAVHAGSEHLQNQPLSSLVECQAGERVALRFCNLGFKEAAMSIDGLDMHVVGRDATLMRGRDGTDTSYVTNTISIAAGESFDVIVTAPAYSGGTGSSGEGFDSYLLYNRALSRSGNLDPGGFGGQATEIHVYPAGSLPAQTCPNT